MKPGFRIGTTNAYLHRDGNEDEIKMEAWTGEFNPLNTNPSILLLSPGMEIRFKGDSFKNISRDCQGILSLGRKESELKRVVIRRF